MGDNTSISWTDATWPVVNGCRRVSPGCERCYAERLIATRLSKVPKYAGLAVFKESGPRWTGESRLWKEHLDWPLRWKRPRKIFVADMGDLFYEGVSDEEIAAVFGVMAACPQHVFQVLTKRPERMRKWFANYGSGEFVLAQIALAWHGIAPCRPLLKRGVSWPLPNVHLGVSVEDQQRADERIPLLLDTPAAVHWVSIEPQLEAVDLSRWLIDNIAVTDDSQDAPDGAQIDGMERHHDEWRRHVGISWCVVGGESGPGARPFDLAWARDIIEQCKATSVPVFVKQLGARPCVTGVGLLDDDDPDAIDVCPVRLKDRKGEDMAEWPEDLRVRQWPTTGAAT